MRIVLSVADCHKAAAILELASTTSSSPHLLHLCTQCLRDIVDIGPTYTQGIRISYPFLADAEKMVRALCGTDPPHAEMMHALAFELFECFVMIAREHAQNKGAKCLSAAQVEVMRCFEAARDWNPNDQTLAAYYYYWLIPGAER